MGSISSKSRELIRSLAKQYVELCNDDRNLNAKELWRKHNALHGTRPPVYIDCWTSSPCLKPELDALLGPYETGELAWAEEWFKKRIWHATFIKDDSVYDPWMIMQSRRQEHKGIWGFEQKRVYLEKSQSFHLEPAITCAEDINKLVATPHVVIDREPPEVKQMRELIGDIMPVHVNCNTSYGLFRGTDLSEAIACLLGYENFLTMLYLEPETIHRIMTFMRDAVLENLEQCEKAGDCSTADGFNYTFLHTMDLPEPKPNVYGAKLKELWCFMHSQEFEGVSPAMYEEFLLNYQLPIMDKYGLVSYGCCESLDRKIELLRKIPNLRSICIGPTANLKNAAEQIKTDYIISWRPSPMMLSHYYSLDNCRQIIRQGLRDSKGCHIHIMLKEFMTLENDFNRLPEFTKMALEEVNSL